MISGKSGNGKQQKGTGRMIDNVERDSRALEDAIKNMEQAKARLAK